MAAQLSGRGAVRGEAIRYDYFSKNALMLQQFSQQSQGRSRVAPLLNQHIQHLAFIIDGASYETQLDRAEKLTPAWARAAVGWLLL